MLLYLVRHGQSQLNVQGVIQGHLDAPLSLLGQHQAQCLSSRFDNVNVVEAWSGDLKRAQQTVKIALQRHDVVPKRDARLRARYMGSLQGKKWQNDIAYPSDVEKIDRLQKRLVSWLTDLVKVHTPLTSPNNTPPDSPVDAASPTDPAIVVVTHEECLLALLDYLTACKHRSESPLHRLEIPSEVRGSIGDWLANTAIVAISLRWDGHSRPFGRLEAYGDASHLAE